MASGCCSPLMVTRFEFRRRDIPDRRAQLEQSAGVDSIELRARGASEQGAVAPGTGGIAHQYASRGIGRRATSAALDDDWGIADRCAGHLRYAVTSTPSFCLRSAGVEFQFLSEDRVYGLFQPVVRFKHLDDGRIDQPVVLLAGVQHQPVQRTWESHSEDHLAPPAVGLLVVDFFPVIVVFFVLVRRLVAGTVFSLALGGRRESRPSHPSPSHRRPGALKPADASHGGRTTGINFAAERDACQHPCAGREHGQRLTAQTSSSLWHIAPLAARHHQAISRSTTRGVAIRPTTTTRHPPRETKAPSFR